MGSRLLRAGSSGWQGGLAFPSALTTGPAAAGYTSLTPAASQEVRNSPYPSFVQETGGGLLIEGYALTGPLAIYADNVTITGCSLTASGGSDTLGLVLYGAGCSLSYCQLSGADSSANRLDAAVDIIGTTGVTMNACNVYWSKQCVLIPSGGQNMTVTNCYFHDTGYESGDHCEPVFLNPGTSGTVISGNTILNPVSQTACIFGNGAVSGSQITGNLLAGGGYTVYASSSSSGLVFESNWFSTAYFASCGYYGPFDGTPAWGSSGNVWSGNYWYDGPSAGQLISAP